MTSIRRLLFLLLICQPLISAAQEKYSVSGYIKDATTSESLIGANVYVKELLKGNSTNQYGFFSFTVPEGKYNLVISFLGYDDAIIPITLDKDLRINHALQPNTISTKEIVITGERSDKNVSNTEMGTIDVSVEKVKALPAFLGETDLLKTIQLLPGVQSAGEGNSGFYVRGGGPDQNLVLLDEANVYNVSHLFGFFSVFNTDAVKNIELIKGGMPAQYGGRLASVLDISMKEGNMNEYQVEGGLGFVASRLTVQGPIKKDTASFIISARRTFIDLFLREPFIKESSNAFGNNYYFYDLNAKLNYRISDKDRIYLSGYFGRDVFKFRSPDSDFAVDIPWGNATASFRWNHLFKDNLFMNTSLIFSDYKFEFGANQSDFEFKLFSGIQDWNAKVDLNWYPNIRHDVKFGFNYIYHTFTPSNASARSGEVDFDLGDIVKLYAHDAAIYINDEYEVSDRVRVSAGLRGTLFSHVGPFDRYIKDSFGETSDTIQYSRGEEIKTYTNIEPRLSMRFAINRSSSVKAAYTKNYQYIHLASLSGVSLPTDTWIPSTDIVKPQIGNQYAMGYFRNFKNNIYEASAEIYYKTMKNQVEYAEGTLPGDDVIDNTDNFLTFGKGKSYGLELFVKKAKGKTSGWIGYTLSWTDRTFAEINNGKTFFAKYDRRHDISIVLTHELNKKWNFGLTWVYATGNSVTIPVSYFVIDGFLVPEYSERNDFRLIPYHRLDLSATYTKPNQKKFESSWNFSIFNVYNRYNPYFIYFDSEGDFDNSSFQVQAKQVSLFPILPSVTYNFKF